MDFKKSSIDEIVSHAIRPQLLLLFALKKSEAEVQGDIKKALNNITTWISMVLNPSKNSHKLKFLDFVAAEQEFNTEMYGIKGNIDSTIMVEDPQGNKLLTALEIKTGKYKQVSYRGQVIIYSLLISERFKNPNKDNILLYIMDQNINEGFQYLK